MRKVKANGSYTQTAEKNTETGAGRDASPRISQWTAFATRRASTRRSTGRPSAALLLSVARGLALTWSFAGACGRRQRALPNFNPIVVVIVVVAECAEEDAKDLAQIHVIRRFVKAQLAAVIQIHCELWREAFTQRHHLCVHLFLANLFVLLLLVGRLQALPGQFRAQKVHEAIAEGFQIVSPRLFDAQVGVDRSVARSTRQVLVFPIVNVLFPWISVLLAETKIDQVDSIPGLANAWKKRES